MLIACSSCHRQYDVGGLPSGERIRCFCGAHATVPAPRARDAEMLHCASCGGTLMGAAGQCGYCGSEVNVAARGLGEVCPGCFARMVRNAKFCSGCGLKIQPQAILKGAVDHSCPRCQATMVLCELDGAGSFVECGRCGGIWLGESQFESMTEQRDRDALARHFVSSEAAPDRPQAAVVHPVSYLACPTCKQPMHRKNFARSGIIIDWCKGHGWWFDEQELHKVLTWAGKGGMAAARTREQEEEAARARKVTFSPDPIPPGGFSDRDEDPLWSVLLNVVDLLQGWFRRK
jgi:Zn-finger nucleic acid-binding protein